MRRERDVVPRCVVGAVGGVGAHHVERGPLARRADWQDAGGGLHIAAAQQERRVHAVALQQRQQHVPDGVRSNRPRAAHVGAELGHDERRPAGRARGGDTDLLDQLPALPLGDPLDRAHQHVEHVHAHRDRVHVVAHPPSAGLVVP